MPCVHAMARIGLHRTRISDVGAAVDRRVGVEPLNPAPGARRADAVPLPTTGVKLQMTTTDASPSSVAGIGVGAVVGVVAVKPFEACRLGVEHV